MGSRSVVIQGVNYTIVGFSGDIVYLQNSKLSKGVYYQINLKDGISSIAMWEDGDEPVFRRWTVDDTIRNYCVNKHVYPPLSMIRYWEKQYEELGYIEYDGAKRERFTDIKRLFNKWFPPVGVWNDLSEIQKDYVVACVTPSAMKEKVMPSIEATGCTSKYEIKRNTNTGGVYVKGDSTCTIERAILSIVNGNNS